MNGLLWQSLRIIARSSDTKFRGHSIWQPDLMEQHNTQVHWQRDASPSPANKIRGAIGLAFSDKSRHWLRQFAQKASMALASFTSRPVSRIPPPTSKRDRSTIAIFLESRTLTAPSSFTSGNIMQHPERVPAAV